MQQDKYEAAVIAGVDMGINCIVNNKSETTFINAGDFVKSHEETIRVYDKTYRFDASDFKTKKADIVITGSTAPVGHLFTHTCWSIVNILPILKKGGTIIFASLCPAVGRLPGFALMDYLEPFLPASPENQELVLKSFYDHSNGLWTGCVWYKLYEAMLHADVHIVTDSSNHGLARKIGFSVFDTVDEAYQKALSKHGNLARVVYVPYGRYTILQA
jgi:lactate racemase